MIESLLARVVSISAVPSMTYPAHVKPSLSYHHTVRKCDHTGIPNKRDRHSSMCTHQVCMQPQRGKRWVGWTLWISVLRKLWGSTFWAQNVDDRITYNGRNGLSPICAEQKLSQFPQFNQFLNLEFLGGLPHSCWVSGGVLTSTLFALLRD